MSDDSPRLYRIQDISHTPLDREFRPSTKISEVTEALKPGVTCCLLLQGRTRHEQLDSNKTLRDYNIGPDEILILRQIRREQKPSSRDPNTSSNRPASTPQNHQSNAPTPQSTRSIASQPVLPSDPSELYPKLISDGYSSELADECCAMIYEGKLTIEQAEAYCRERTRKEEPPIEPPPTMEPPPVEPQISLDDVRTLTRDEIMEIRKCEPRQIADIIDYMMKNYPRMYDIISRNKAVVAEVFGFDVSLFS